MDNNVLIVLIVSVTVIIILLLFRKQLSSFLFKAGKEGVQAELKTRKPENSTFLETSGKRGERSADTVVRNNKLFGKKNEMTLDGSRLDASDNLLVGEENEIKSSSKPSQPQK
jgi:hypothetical protein